MDLGGEGKTEIVMKCGVCVFLKVNQGGEIYRVVWLFETDAVILVAVNNLPMLHDLFLLTALRSFILGESGRGVSADIASINAPND